MQKFPFPIQKFPFQIHNTLILITFTLEGNFGILFFHSTFEIFYMKYKLLNLHLVQMMAFHLKEWREKWKMPISDRRLVLWKAKLIHWRYCNGHYFLLIFCYQQNMFMYMYIYQRQWLTQRNILISSGLPQLLKTDLTMIWTVAAGIHFV